MFSRASFSFVIKHTTQNRASMDKVRGFSFSLVAFVLLAQRDYARLFVGI
jgi:hypothetical protein